MSCQWVQRGAGALCWVPLPRGGRRSAAGAAQDHLISRDTSSESAMSPECCWHTGPCSDLVTAPSPVAHDKAQRVPQSGQHDRASVPRGRPWLDAGGCRGALFRSRGTGCRARAGEQGHPLLPRVGQGKEPPCWLGALTQCSPSPSAAPHPAQPLIQPPRLALT